jgi:hypothetical protein
MSQRNDIQLNEILSNIKANSFQQLSDIFELKKVGLDYNQINTLQTNLINISNIISTMTNGYTTNTQKNIAADYAGKIKVDYKEYDGYWVKNYSVTNYTQ